MYEATQEQKYLDIAEDLYGGCCTSSWSYSWDSKGACVCVCVPGMGVDWLLCVVFGPSFDFTFTLPSCHHTQQPPACSSSCGS